MLLRRPIPRTLLSKASTLSAHAQTSPARPHTAQCRTLSAPRSSYSRPKDGDQVVVAHVHHHGLLLERTSQRSVKCEGPLAAKLRRVIAAHPTLLPFVLLSRQVRMYFQTVITSQALQNRRRTVGNVRHSHTTLTKGARPSNRCVTLKILRRAHPRGHWPTSRGTNQIRMEGTKMFQPANTKTAPCLR